MRFMVDGWAPDYGSSLQEVEEILGVALFERTPRGVVPTAFGEAFIVHAQNVIAELDRALEAV